jgi:hypothetical protein
MTRTIRTLLSSIAVYQETKAKILRVAEYGGSESERASEISSIAQIIFQLSRQQLSTLSPDTAMHLTSGMAHLFPSNYPNALT